MDTQTLINEFTTHLKRSNKTKSTIIAYQKDITQLSESNINKSLIDFNETDVRNALSYFHNVKNLSAKTVSRKLNSIRTFYKFLEGKRLIMSNPAINISHPKFRAKKQRFLSRMEFLALREVSRENPRLFAMIELMLQTGIRIGELSRIKIKDVHLDTSKPFIYLEKFDSSPERNVPLSSKIAHELKEYLKIDSVKNKADNPLFCTKSGKSIEIRNIRSSIDRAIIKAKIKNTCVNDLRNTFIVHQLNHGMSLTKVAEIVGHKNTVTTSRYLEILPKKYKPSGVEGIVEL